MPVVFIFFINSQLIFFNYVHVTIFVPPLVIKLWKLLSFCTMFSDLSNFSMRTAPILQIKTIMQDTKIRPISISGLILSVFLSAIQDTAENSQIQFPTEQEHSPVLTWCFLVKVIILQRTSCHFFKMRVGQVIYQWKVLVKWYNLGKFPGLLALPKRETGAQQLYLRMSLVPAQKYLSAETNNSWKYV